MWFFIAGIVVGLGLLLLVLWLRRRNVAIAWYEWLIGIIGLALIAYGIQNFTASSAGGEPSAPGVFLLIFGLPGAILLLIAGALAWWGYMRKRKPRALASD